MSLSNRLSLFFLAAIGLVLLGFSLAVYVLVRGHLAAQLEHRRDATTHALLSAIEIHPNDVEWEPLERKIKTGEDPSTEQPRWAVHDLTGKLIDCSPNLEDSNARTIADEPGWRVTVCRIRAGSFEAEPDNNGSAFNSLNAYFPVDAVPGQIALPADRTYQGDGLILTSAVSERPMRDALANLVVTLVTVSTGIWLTAALWGRWLCRKALQPITQMAQSARAIRSDPHGQNALAVATTGDELEDLGTAFNELLADLKDSVERQERFSGDASHQLRTPLTALLTATDVALRQERTPAEYRRVLHVVQRRGGQIREITETLLLLARSDTSTVAAEFVTVNLTDLVQERLAHWAEHPRAMDVQLASNDHSICVKTHPVLLAQIIDNLLDNACKYSDPNTPITLSINLTGDTAVFAITDEGCGITESDLKRVYEPFFRSEQARYRGQVGVGLGLSVVHHLLGILGGHIEATSVLGRGSCFRIFLPCWKTPKDGQELTQDGQDEVPQFRPQMGEDMRGVYMPCVDSADQTTERPLPQRSGVTTVEESR